MDRISFVELFLTIKNFKTMKNLALILIALTPALWASAQQNPGPDMDLKGIDANLISSIPITQPGTPAIMLFRKSSNDKCCYELKLAEEGYVNDIPFNTSAIAGKCMLFRNMEMSEEACIDDIPFNTEKIFYKKLAERMTEQYRNEAEIYDLPYVPDYIICSHEISVLP